MKVNVKDKLCLHCVFRFQNVVIVKCFVCCKHLTLYIKLSDIWRNRLKIALPFKRFFLNQKGMLYWSLKARTTIINIRYDSILVLIQKITSIWRYLQIFWKWKDVTWLFIFNYLNIFCDLVLVGFFRSCLTKVDAMYSHLKLKKVSTYSSWN